MALPVLDGNQSATTLSSVVTGGEHIVAHSVVSLGTTAIANINSAVSGSAVTIPGLARLGNSIASDNTADANLDFIKIGGHQDGQNQVAHIVHVSAGGAMKVDASGSSVTFSQAPVTFGAITGSASILNFPSTQTIAGTVTANNNAIDNYLISAFEDVATSDASVAIRVQGTPGYPMPISGTVTANVAEPAPGVSTFISESGSFSPVYAVGIGYNTANNAEFLAVNDSGNNFPVAVNNSVTIGSLPAISGAVTVSNATTASAVAVRLIAEDTNPGGSGAGVNVNLYSNDNALLVDALKNGNSVLGYDGLSSYVQVKPAIGSSVTIGSLPAISGTVTVGNNNFNIKTVIAQDGSANFTAFNGTQFRLYTPTGASKTLNNIFGAIPSWVVAFSDSVTWFSDSGTQVAYFHDGTQWTLDDFTTPAGTLALDGSVFITNLSSESSINLLNGFTAAQLGSAFVNGSGALRVNLYSSTVTAAAPNGSLTTRFGTPTTANTAFATAAVTKSDRKYLLIQNVTTGSNVITVGIGFTPTTTQGIQLTAGAGITFESSYIPTGQVFVLSSVTASNFTILEA